MSRLAAALSVPVLVLLTVMLAPPIPAAATPTAGAQQQGSPLARLQLESLSPRVVTAAAPDRLTVTGRVVNIGDRGISDLGVRVQRDGPLDDEDAARAALTSTPDAPFITEFTPLDVELQPGQSAPFRIEVALGPGPELQALQISEPGVYPLLVNLNGTPDFGGPARLASVPRLLPVLELPAATDPTTDGSAAEGPPPAPAPTPVPLSIVWPLVAEPARRLSEPGETLLLAGGTRGSDPMAAQLTPGGRLDGLVRALEQVVTPGSPLARSLCVAVDPALLDTVAGMTRGYRVTTPTGIRDGTGAAAARQWLDRLQATVAGRCVLPLPYGDPDVVALSRAGLTDLEALAVSTGTQVVRDVLGATPLVGVSWPADGVLDERTLSDLAALDTRAVLLEPQGVSAPPDRTDVATLASGTVGGARPAPQGLLGDPLLSAALPSTPQPLAAQNAIGVLAFRANAADRRPVLLVPPRRWQIGRAEATQLLRNATRLLERNLVIPRTLPEMADGEPSGPQTSLDYPSRASAREIPVAVTADVAAARDVLRDLQVATERDPTADLAPAELLDPIRLAMLRSVSTAWRGDSVRAAALVDDVTDRLDELRGDVRIVPPPGPYTLASSNSPLLITVRNELPVSMEMALSLEQTPGLRTGAVGVQLVPARSSRQFVIPAEVVRAGQFSVDARLTTPGGTPLGRPSTLQLQSSAFDAVTVALTAGAGGLLVLLVGRRIVRRNRDRRNEAAPE